MPQIMDTFVYFEKISEEISKHLEAATHEIVIAIAWFTDASLLNIFYLLLKGKGKLVRLK